MEKQEHYYSAVHTKLAVLGLQPHLLSDELIESVLTHHPDGYKDRVIAEGIDPTTSWKGGAPVAAQPAT